VSLIPPPPLEVSLNYELDIAKIPVENGMLIFKDNAHFTLTAEHCRKTKEEQPQFATRTESESFISMKMAFDSINNHQGFIADSLELLETNNPGSISEAVFNNTHSALLQIFKNAYKIMTMEDGGKYLELNTREYNIAEIINKDGFVQIGNKLYKVEYDTLRTMENGTSEDFSTLGGAVTSDPARGITVEIVTSNGTIARTMGLPEYSALRKECQTTIDKVRVRGNYDMITYKYQDNPLAVIPQHRVRTIGLKRRLWGVWWDAPDNGTIGTSATWNVIGNSSSGFYMQNGNNIGATIFWTSTGYKANSKPLTDVPISYNPNTQGNFITQMLPIVYQASTRHYAIAFKPNAQPLGSVTCNCTHN
jgi:hypothetical protein